MSRWSNHIDFGVPHSCAHCVPSRRPLSRHRLLPTSIRAGPAGGTAGGEHPQQRSPCSPGRRAVLRHPRRRTEHQPGDPGTGYALMLEAARRSGDAQLYRRATEIALQSRSGEYALAAARAWKEAQPQSREANRYVLQILIALNRIPETGDLLRQELAQSPAKDRLLTLQAIPQLYGRAPDKAAAAAIVEKALADQAGEPGGRPARLDGAGTDAACRRRPQGRARGRPQSPGAGTHAGRRGAALAAAHGSRRSRRRAAGGPLHGRRQAPAGDPHGLCGRPPQPAALFRSRDAGGPAHAGSPGHGRGLAAEGNPGPAIRPAAGIRSGA